MKNLLQMIIFGSILSLSSTVCFSQAPIGTATLDLTLQCAGGTNNRAGIGYNPNQQLYYSINAGSGGYPIETFSMVGAPLSSIASGYSYRGLWWNPNNSTLEGKVYSAAGIVMQNLDASYYPLGTGTTIVTGSGPDPQSCGDYDWVDDEVLYYFNGSIYRYDRTTHTLISSVAITGLPVAIANLNNNTAGYTNIAGMEAGVYDYVNKAFYFINKLTGAYVATCQLPLTAPASASFQMGFENSHLWLYNTGTSEWEGYAAVTTSCSTTSNIAETSCSSYTSPSGNYTWTTSNVYYDTIPNGGGCDSLMTIDLTIIPPMTGAVGDTICSNGSVLVNGNTYDALTPSGTEVFTGVGPFGCDSTVSINLVVIPAIGSTIDQTICAGESIVVNGTTYSATVTGATEVFPGIGAFGCDSIVTINLVVESAIDVSVLNSSPSLSSNQSGATYQWLDCDNGNAVIVGETSQTYNATANGNYAVEITVGSCVDTSACENIDGIGLDELFGNDIRIYPNPTQNKVTVDLGLISGLVSYSIATIDGKIISRGVTTNSTIVLDLSNESNGVYLLRLNSEDGSTIRKIVKK